MWFRTKMFTLGALLLASTAVMLTRAEEPAQPVADPFAVPDGTPAELLALIEQFRAVQPDGTGREEVQAFQKKMIGAIGEAADKILNAKPTEEQLQEAVNWKMSAMLTLRRMGSEEAAAELEAFPARMANAGHQEIARQITGFLLNDQLRQAMMAGPEPFLELLGRIKEFVGEGPIGRAEAGLILGAAQSLEQLEDADLAAKAYRDFGKLLATSEEPEIAALGAKLDGAARRIGLVGKPMHLEGTYLDGTPFDWAAYKDKPVLVQFWATWCGPCRQEIVNIRRNWDLYHERGFEVVAVNCDDDRAQLEAFLKENDMPWKQLFSADPEAMGMDHPMATHYGVMGIPTLILVGPDGKVVSLSARGEELTAYLEELYGPAEKPAAGT